MEEGKDHDCIVIFSGDGHQVQVVVLVEVEEVVISVLDEGFQGVLVVLKDLLVEDVVDVGGEVWSEMPGDEDTALLVEDVDGRNATHSKIGRAHV